MHSKLALSPALLPTCGHHGKVDLVMAALICDRLGKRCESNGEKKFHDQMEEASSHSTLAHSDLQD